MGAWRAYSKSAVKTTKDLHAAVQAVYAIGALAVAVVAWWRFGWAWAITALALCFVVLSVMTGLQVVRDHHEIATNLVGIHERYQVLSTAVRLEGERFHPSQLLPDGTSVVANREFINCYFVGPAILYLFQNCQVSAGTFVPRLPGTPVDAILWPQEPPRAPNGAVGVITFVHCTFDRCTFEEIGFYGPPQVLESIRKSPMVF